MATNNMTVIELPEESIPMDKWHKDHWSTLAYINAVIVDHGYFEIGLDGQMRTKQYNFCYLLEKNSKPKRTKLYTGVAMSADGGTRIKDNIFIRGHDDWDCVSDFLVAGLFNEQSVEPGVKLHLSDFGSTVCASLRKHKANGGTFATFVYENDGT